MVYVVANIVHSGIQPRHDVHIRSVETTVERVWAVVELRSNTPFRKKKVSSNGRTYILWN
jgi:hypothetical protein